MWIAVHSELLDELHERVKNVVYFIVHMLASLERDWKEIISTSLENRKKIIQKHVAFRHVNQKFTSSITTILQIFLFLYDPGDRVKGETIGKTAKIRNLQSLQKCINFIGKVSSLFDLTQFLLYGLEEKQQKTREDLKKYSK